MASNEIIDFFPQIYYKVNLHIHMFYRGIVKMKIVLIKLTDQDNFQTG